MPSTPRDEMVAEYVARDAVSLVGNRLALILNDEEKDIAAILPAPDREDLIQDERLNTLFVELWPDGESEDSAEHRRASAQACYIAARILRAAVYHAEHLRGEAQHLFELAEKKGIA